MYRSGESAPLEITRFRQSDAGTMFVVGGCPILRSCLLWPVCGLLLLVSSADAQISAGRLNEFLLSFDVIRETIEARYPNEERLDDEWHAASDELRIELEGAESEDEARSYLIALAMSLGESHFAVIPRDSYEVVYEEEGTSDDSESDEANSGSDPNGESGSGKGSGDDTGDRASSDSDASSDSMSDSGQGSESESGSDPEEDHDSESGLAADSDSGSESDSDSDSGSDSDSDSEEDLPPEGNVGLDVRFIDDQVVVTGIEDGSSAEAAGMLPGDQLLSIDGQSVDSLIEVLRELEETSVSRLETDVAFAAKSRLDGAIGDRLEIEFCRMPGDTQAVELTVQPWNGVATTLGALPEQVVSTYSRDLGDVGVIGFSLFMAPETVMPFIQKSIEEFHDKDGIILDVRGNYGGIMAMIQGIVGWFVHEPEQLGRLKMRGADLKFFANPRPNAFKGKVAVLTDELSISSAELFSAAIKDTEVGRLFGRRTAGLALPANIQRLPNGDGFLFVVADYQTTGGERLEQEGVIPHVEVDFDRMDLYEDPDPVLTEALEWIRSGKIQSIDPE